MNDSKVPGRADNRWRISARTRGRGVRIEPVPNERLRRPPSGTGGPDEWESAGARACFSLDAGAPSPPLAPGWYEVRGNLEVRAGKAMLPSLYVRYAEGSALANTELTLSGPDATGRVSALLLFYDTVQSLAFYPSIYPARFVMHDFSLRRVSRWHALRHMLGGPRLGTQGSGSAGRALAWSRSVTGRGLKRATDGLYADYRRRLHPPGLGDYEIWTRKYDTLSAIELAAFRRRAQALDDRGPLISLLLAVDDIPAPSLRRCLDRVLDQVWARWELCVVDRATRAPQVSSVLAEYARRDARIRVMRCERDENIAEASNAVLAMARGEFVALLDADDQLRPHALLRVAESIVADSGLAIVYSDEDRLDPAGQRIDPHFKPDWNPDLLRSRNYFGHLTSIRAALVREAGGFRAGLEDSRDYDLILRCVEQVEPEQIRHIPEILCHRHVTADRATTGRDATQVAATGARALTEHLQRIGADAEIESSGLPPGYHRVRWHLPRPVPKASLIIPTRDRLELLRTCVESILAKSTHPDFEIVVVDNQSGDGATLRYLRELETRENVRVLRYDAPFNYSAINNWAAHQCDGPLIGLVNNDIEVITPDWLEEMAGFAARPDTGAVGAMLYYPDDTIQHAGVLLGMLGLAGHIGAKKPRGWAGHAGRGLVAQNLSAVTGACLLVRREVFEEVGGLDERLPVAFNDIDFCLRVRARGYRNVWTPFAELYHHESASRGDDDTVEKMARSNSEVAFMQARWGQALREDPAYNPNLSLQSQHFELAFPPRDGAATTLG